MTKIVIGTRGSPLALWQANYVRDTLIARDPQLQIELKVIKTKGSVLTLTGQEAVDCGLARGVVAGIRDVTKTLDPKRSQYHAWQTGYTFMRNKIARNRLAFRQAKYLQSIAPQLAALDKEYKALNYEAKDLIAERNRLKRQYESERGRVADEYRRRIRRAEEQFLRDLPNAIWATRSPDLYYRQLHDARRNRARRIEDAEDDLARSSRRVDARYKDVFREIDTRYRRLDQEARQVRAKRKKLIDAGPK